MDGKRKNIVLVCVLALLFYLSYVLAIKNTLALKSEYNTLKEESLQVKEIPKKFAVLGQKERQLESVLKRMSLGNTSLQNNLLKTLNSQADLNNLFIIGFKEPHKVVENDNAIITYEFTVEGNFTNILKTINNLENKGSFGEVIHVKFLKPQRRKKALQATILIKSVQ